MSPEFKHVTVRYRGKPKWMEEREKNQRGGMINSTSQCPRCGKWGHAISTIGCSGCPTSFTVESPPTPAERRAESPETLSYGDWQRRANYLEQQLDRQGEIFRSVCSAEQLERVAKLLYQDNPPSRRKRVSEEIKKELEELELAMFKLESKAGLPLDANQVLGFLKNYYVLLRQREASNSNPPPILLED